MTRACELLILGLGNVLCGDDGVGCAVVAELGRTYRAVEGVEVLDGGTLGLSLLPHLTAARRAILVDAVSAAAAPGTLVRLSGGEVPPAVWGRLSPHQVGVADLLQGAQLLGECPSTLVLLGLVPATIELGIGLSPQVRASLPRLLGAVVAEAKALGFSLPVRGDDEICREGRIVDRDSARQLGLPR